MLKDFNLFEKGNYKYEITSNKYIYNVKYITKSNTVLIEKDIDFLFAYYKKDHAKVFFKYIEEDGDVYDDFKKTGGYIRKVDLSKTSAGNLLAEVITKEYNYSGDLLSRKIRYEYFRREDVSDFLEGEYRKGVKFRRELSIIPREDSEFDLEKQSIKFNL